MIREAGLWLVLVALAIQGVVMALTALSSGYDDQPVLRVSGRMGLGITILLIVLGIPILPALAIGAFGPVIAFLVCLPHSHAHQLFSRGPYADVMAGHGVRSFANAKGSEHGRHNGRSLSRFLCGERFEPGTGRNGATSGEYIASTILLDGALCDVNLQAIFGWMPRDPWVAVLTEEEINAIRFAMHPAPPVEELLAARASGEFFIHDSFGEANLRSYIVANHPDLLVDSALHEDGVDNPVQNRIRRTEKARAMQWGWAVVVSGALPLLFAWALIAGNIFGGGI